MVAASSGAGPLATAGHAHLAGRGTRAFQGVRHKLLAAEDLFPETVHSIFKM